jgi:uncharacterized OsmC-like protein
MSTLTVYHLDGDRFAVCVRDHLFTVDQPFADGGDDSGPTPLELFVGSLTSCVAHHARRYLALHCLPSAGLTVSAEYVTGSHPARVTDVRLEVLLPDGIPAEHRDRVLAVASRCTVHNSLATPPVVTMALAGVPVGTG